MMKRLVSLLIGMVLMATQAAVASTIEVQIKGIDDGVRSTAQKDYKEAVLFAKREAIERAGVTIKAMTTVKDLILASDYIESQAEAVLLPGYQIMDIGYQKDGTYLIVLTGKVKTADDSIASKELRYAKSLMDRGMTANAKDILEKVIQSGKVDNNVAEALYYSVVWGFADNDGETYERLKAYYPDSRYVPLTEAAIYKKRKDAMAAEERRRREQQRLARQELERRSVEAVILRGSFDETDNYDTKTRTFTGTVVQNDLTEYPVRIEIQRDCFRRKGEPCYGIYNAPAIFINNIQVGSGRMEDEEQMTLTTQPINNERFRFRMNKSLLSRGRNVFWRIEFTLGR